ncbi:MAG: chemotaxis protein CheW [Pontixanthobacter sp.]
MKGELLVLVEIGGRRAAIPAVEVQSVIELEDIYPVPHAPGHVTGLTAMRSQSLTVVDCCKSLGIGNRSGPGERSPVVEIDGYLYALQVDLVDDVIAAQSDLFTVSGGFGAAWKSAARGMVETEQGPTLVLDVKSLISGQPITAAA